MAKRKRLMGSVCLLVAGSLLAAACGGDDDSDASDTGSAGTSAAPTSASPTTSTAPTDSGSPATTTASEETAAPTTMAPATTEATPAANVDPNGEFTFAFTAGYKSLDPHKSLLPSDGIFQRPLYDSLVRLQDSADGVTLEPWLASSWEASPDSKSLTLTLRDDVMFQDGNPFNAEAVKANIERAKAPESPITSGQLNNVESVEVVDDTHVIFHLTNPDPAFIWTLGIQSAGMMISPAAFDSNLETKPVGTGPYTLVSASPDSDTVYERWDGYWNPDLALAKQITISVVPDGNARFNGVRSGQYSQALLYPPQDVQGKDLVSEGFQYVLKQSPLPWGVYLNADKGPFGDARVRQAISMAIDRTAITTALFGGLSTPAYQPFAQGIVGYDPALDKDPYDVEAAKQLIKDAGAEGASFTIIFSPEVPPSGDIATILQQALGDIGLNVEVQPVAAAEAGPGWIKGDYDAFVSPISGEVEPSKTLNASYLQRLNPAQTKPQEFLDLAQTAMSLPLDSPDREAAYQAVAHYIVDNAYSAIPISWGTTAFLAGADVVGADLITIRKASEAQFLGVGIAAG